MARNRTRKQRLAELERLKRELEHEERSVIQRGELREVYDAVEQRLTAWWADGDPERARAVVAATFRVPVERLPPSVLEDPVKAARAIVRTIREGMLKDHFSPTAEDYPLGRRPEFVAELIESFWKSLVLALSGRDLPPPEH